MRGVVEPDVAARRPLLSFAYFPDRTVRSTCGSCGNRRARALAKAHDVLPPRGCVVRVGILRRADGTGPCAIRGRRHPRPSSRVARGRGRPRGPRSPRCTECETGHAHGRLHREQPAPRAERDERRVVVHHCGRENAKVGRAPQDRAIFGFSLGGWLAPTIAPGFDGDKIFVAKSSDAPKVGVIAGTTAAIPAPPRNPRSRTPGCEGSLSLFSFRFSPLVCPTVSSPTP